MKKTSSDVLTLEMHLKRCKRILAEFIDFCQCGCQCGYFEDATGDPDPAMNICALCAARQQLEDMRDLKFTEVSSA